MSDELEHVVITGLDEIGFDLVELRKGGSRSRPVLEVRIDRPRPAAVVRSLDVLRVEQVHDVGQIRVYEKSARLVRAAH